MEPINQQEQQQSQHQCCQEPYQQTTDNSKPNIESLLSTISFENTIESQIGLSIQKIGNSIQITNLDGGANQCHMTSSLSLNGKYVIRLKLNNSNKNIPHFCFGLIASKQKDTAFLWQEQLYYSETKAGGGGLNKLLKGQSLQQKKHKKNIGEKTMELRICLEDRFMRIADFPMYENVLELNDPTLIDPNVEYHFAVYILYKNNSLTVLDFQKVDRFDGRM